jgi:hypothetical protein
MFLYRCAYSRLKLRCAYRIVGGVFSFCAIVYSIWEFKEEAMRKVLLLALVALFLGAACSKSEETAPAAPEASPPAAEASPAAPAPSPGGDMGSPAASPAAP